MKNAFKLAALGLVITLAVACNPTKTNSTDKTIDTVSNKVETKSIDTVSNGVDKKAIDTVSNGTTLKTKSIDTVSNKVMETKTKQSESKIKVKKVIKE